MSRIKNTLIILLIIALSVGTGWVYDTAAAAVLKKNYPREYNADVVNLAYEYSIPASVVYASIKVRSNFNSALVTDDGEVGLFRLSAAQYFALAGDDGDGVINPGLLYEPKTSIRLGTKWIASLYDKYGDWDAVYAAMYAGEEKVDGWLSGPSGSVSLCDDETAQYVKTMNRAVARYLELYETEETPILNTH